ncbi:MAG: hypothetical protein JW807_03025 [Spirochaetes bacterium]|nr:hypothetical protein [Spirochaetota bacterium]
MNRTGVTTDAGGNFAESLTVLLGAVAETREFNSIIGGILPAILGQWAGRNPIKKLMALILEKIAAGGFISRAHDETTRDMASLMKDPGFIAMATREAPVVVEGIMGAAGSFVEGIEGLPAEEKKALLDGMFAGTGRGHAGAIITSFARITNGLHDANPHYFAEKLEPIFRRFVEDMDFGEIKELFDSSRKDMVETVRMANRVMWDYPSKVICVLAMLPSVLNTVLESIGESLEPLNTMAPDLLADVVLSLMRDIDGQAIGSLVNHVSELVRKIHTGSSLIGEQGKPQFPVAVNHVVAGVLSALDVNLLLKARSLLAEIREITLGNFIELLGSNKALAREFFQSHFRSLVSDIRTLSRKADALDNLFTSDEIAEEFSRGMGEIDAQQLGETISILAAQLNEVRKRTPGVIRTVLTQIMNSIDSRELGETARWLTNDIVRSMKPVAPEVLPPIIKGVAELLSPDEYDDPGEIEEAIASLRQALLGREVAK